MLAQKGKLYRCNMASNVMKKPTAEQLDGFSGYSSEVEGAEDRGGGSLIRGQRVKFKDAKWITHPEGVVLPPTLELVVYDLVRVVNKWGKDQSKGPLEERVLGPGEPFPDFKKLNAEAPREEWYLGPNGELVGPYSGQKLVYLLDMQTMARYTWTDPLTVGGSIAIENLVDQTNLKRKASRDTSLFPVITLGDTFMPTRFGGRQRPHLIIVGFIPFGSSGSTPVTGPTEPQLPPAGDAKKTSTAKTIEGKPTAKEVVDDDIPY